MDATGPIYANAPVVVNGIENARQNGRNTMTENEKPPKPYELKKIYRTLYCPNPEFCENEHNEDTGHHYGCLCVPCTNFYYRKLK
jgi:hypothetical protein